MMITALDVTFLQLDARALARVPASEAEVLVVHMLNSQARKSVPAPQVDFSEGADEAVQDEIVSSNCIAVRILA